MWFFELVVLILVLITVFCFCFFRYSLAGVTLGNYSLVATSPCQNNKSYQLYQCLGGPCSAALQLTFASKLVEQTCSLNKTPELEVEGNRYFCKTGVCTVHKGNRNIVLGAFQPEKMVVGQTIFLSAGPKVEKTSQGWLLDNVSAELTDIIKADRSWTKPIIYQSREIQLPMEDRIIFTRHCPNKELLATGVFAQNKPCRYLPTEIELVFYGLDSGYYTGQKHQLELSHFYPTHCQKDLYLEQTAAAFLVAPQGYYVFLADKTHGWLQKDYSLGSEPTQMEFPGQVLAVFKGESLYQSPLNFVVGRQKYCQW